MDSGGGEKIIEQLPKISRNSSGKRIILNPWQLLLHWESGYAGQSCSTCILQILCDSFDTLKLRYTEARFLFYLSAIEFY